MRSGEVDLAVGGAMIEAPATAPLIEGRSLTKRFGATVALDNVSFSVRGGETHVLLGENGAGKSTLVKIFSGIYRRSRGGST